MTARAFLPPAAAAGAALVLLMGAAGCGGSSNSASETSASATTTATSDTSTEDSAAQATAGGETTLRIAADPTGKLEFDQTRLEAPAGRVTIVLTNDSDVPHNVAIEGNGEKVESPQVAGGETTQLTAALEPGTYEFLCTVPGHAEAGMKGTLVVTGR